MYCSGWKVEKVGTYGETYDGNYNEGHKKNRKTEKKMVCQRGHEKTPDKLEGAGKRSKRMKGS